MRYFIIIVSLTIGIKSFASPIDTTLFITDFEKNIFLNLLNSNEIDPFDLFICIDYNLKTREQAKQGLDRIIQYLESKELSKKSKKKQIKQIYKYIHSSTLTKYDAEKYFSDIFIKGEYNCVTASALYALVLNHFNIEYIIKETPHHVYLIADPGDTRILIETTLPYDGVLVYDEKFKSEFVQYLVSNKTISREEFDVNSIDYLFDKNYDDNKEIDIFQLGAIHYYNKGIYKFNESKYTEAARIFEKAHLIYKTNLISYMLNASYGNLLWDQANDEEYSGETLAKYLNINSNNSEAIETIKDHFYYVSNELTNNHPDIQAYKSFYKEFVFYVTDSIDIYDFTQTYYHKMGYYNYVNQNYYTALQELNLAYLTNSDNISIKQLIHDVGIKYLCTDRMHESAIDSLEHYFDIFPFLFEDEFFQRYYTYCYMRVIYTNFEYNRETKGAEILARFDKVVEENRDIVFHEEVIENTFRLIAGYYISNSQITKAIQYINKGLELVPYSISLSEMKNSIVDYQKNLSEIEIRRRNTVVPSRETFKNKFNNNFQKCWITKSVIEGSEEKDMLDEEHFTISVISKKKVEFIIDNVVRKGRWDIRYKSKLLYLVPEKDEKNYIVFKIIDIDENNLKLRAYEGDKLSSRIITFIPCK